MRLGDKRETYLKVLGVFFIFLGSMTFIVGILKTLVISKMISMGKLPPKSFFFMTPKLFITIEILLSLVIIYSGISFLRKKRWARTVLEVISWIYLAEIVINFFLGLKGLFFTNYKNPYTPEYAQKIIQTIILFLYAFIYGGITSFILYVLRKKEFKELFHKKVKE